MIFTNPQYSVNDYTAIILLSKLPVSSVGYKVTLEWYDVHRKLRMMGGDANDATVRMP